MNEKDIFHNIFPIHFPFFSGEIEKPCVLVLVDDTEHEEDEELRLVLGSPKSESPFGASIGGQNETLIKIKDDADSKYICVVLQWFCLKALCASCL